MNTYPNVFIMESYDEDQQTGCRHTDGAADDEGIGRTLEAQCITGVHKTQAASNTGCIRHRLHQTQGA